MSCDFEMFNADQNFYFHSINDFEINYLLKLKIYWHYERIMSTNWHYWHILCFLLGNSRSVEQSLLRHFDTREHHHIITSQYRQRELNPVQLCWEHGRLEMGAKPRTHETLQFLTSQPMHARRYRLATMVIINIMLKMCFT